MSSEFTRSIVTTAIRDPLQYHLPGIESSLRAT
jgi:hypothetical protein